MSLQSWISATSSSAASNTSKISISRSKMPIYEIGSSTPIKYVSTPYIDDTSRVVKDVLTPEETKTIGVLKDYIKGELKTLIANRLHPFTPKHKHTFAYDFAKAESYYIKSVFDAIEEMLADGVISETAEGLYRNLGKTPDEPRPERMILKPCV